MATGQTPTPAYKTGDNLAYGAAQTVAELEATMPDLQDSSQDEPYQPQTPEEQFLFSPSDRPDEPATHGAPFGPGANFTRFSYESDNQFLARVATDLQTDPNATQEVRNFVARITRGE